MKKVEKGGLTKFELRLMQVIWRRGESTVAEVQEGLEPAAAYTTVQTMLNILERKGKLERELRGRAYVYRARVSEANALGQAVLDLVNRMFGGSSEALVMNLVESRQLDRKKLAELTDRLDEEGGAR